MHIQISEFLAVRECIQTGDWSKCKMPGYLCVKNELCTIGKIVLRGNRIVIPKYLQNEVLQLAHEGHPGIVKMETRLRTKVWFPSMDNQAEKLVKQ